MNIHVHLSYISFQFSFHICIDVETLCMHQSTRHHHRHIHGDMICNFIYILIEKGLLYSLYSLYSLHSLYFFFYSPPLYIYNHANHKQHIRHRSYIYNDVLQSFYTSESFDDYHMNIHDFLIYSQMFLVIYHKYIYVQ